MGKLHFAFWDVIPHSSSGAGIAGDYDAHIRLAQHVEALGWHSYFVIEHQNTPQGTSSPSVYLTAVARETSTLRLGAMMWQLPFYHPLRLAQDVAMLDSQRADNLARGQTMAEAARNYDFNVEQGLTLVGSPATVIRQLQDGQQRMGYDLFCTNHQIGRMPAEMVSRSIDLFGKEVIPAFASPR